MCVCVCVCNKISFIRNILTIKKIHREVGWAKYLSAPRYIQPPSKQLPFTVIITADTAHNVL